MAAKSQFIITGTIYDSTKTIPIKDVVVQCSSGDYTITDSNGHYAISASGKDSIIFIYQNKPTLKFAVKQITNIVNFDIALHVRVNEKFKTLKEVKVYAKNHRQDSIANREQYARIFNYEKPGISVTTNSYSGTPGVDLDELINVFRFRRNRQLRKMQERLEEEEKEKYINYRFNKATVRRITQLDEKDLDSFMKEYRPEYEFTAGSSLPEFYQYMLNSSYEFKSNKEKENFINNRFNKEIVKTISGLNDKNVNDFMRQYRPGYDFTKNSTPQQFYDYILVSSVEFKKQQAASLNKINDSLHKN